MSLETEVVKEWALRRPIPSVTCAINETVICPRCKSTNFEMGVERPKFVCYECGLLFEVKTVYTIKE